MGKIKTLRCPHCGTYFPEPKMQCFISLPFWKKRFRLLCPYCLWRGKLARTQRGAIKLWNNDPERRRLHRDGQVDSVPEVI